ncbi:MAG TPA: VOC family protein [Candidatus Binataceae bacterium]|nr:VOC family protein [Candidatus Binataceae bacterium]
MLSHVSIGVKDIARARKFYDAALKPLGYKCLVEGSEYLGYGADSPEYWILAARSPVPADPASGLHFCFDANSRADVNGFYEAALHAGGKDNGKPGIRKDYGENYYAAFAIDPEGYRLEVFTTSAK